MMRTQQEPVLADRWLAVLNHEPRSIMLGQTRADVIYHGYSARHPDNHLHRHSVYEVCFVSEGTGRFVAGGETSTIAPGDIFVARPNIIHRILSTSRPEMELYWIAYQLHSLGGERGAVTALLERFAASSHVVVADDGRCAKLWATLRTIASGDEIEGVQEQLGWLSGCLITAIAQLTAPGPARAQTREGHDTRLIQQAMRFIEDNLTQSLSPIEVANQVGLSQRHFSRLFRAQTGLTFLGYVNRARIDRALARLQQSDAPIKAIAAELGFSDIHYFARIFTRTIGMPPGQVRWAAREAGGSVPVFGESV
jgi:AraC-like DNA-binding protein/mannose-6-phosphate isomerase-like protein (cupin superfamily)